MIQETLLYFSKFYCSHSSVVFKNEWSYTSAPLVYVRAVDKDKLTLHSLNVAFGCLRCERFAELQIWLLCKDSGNVSYMFKIIQASVNRCLMALPCSGKISCVTILI
jgi:hypothetical protein